MDRSRLITSFNLNIKLNISSKAILSESKSIIPKFAGFVALAGSSLFIWIFLLFTSLALHFLSSDNLNEFLILDGSFFSIFYWYGGVSDCIITQTIGFGDIHVGTFNSG